MDIGQDECRWLQTFTEYDRTIYKRGLVWSATAATIMGCLTNTILLGSSMKDDPSYRNFSVFTMTAFVRRMLYLSYYFFQFYGLDVLWSPELLAFLETFTAVLEIETLTHACIERYVMSKYITRGWELLKKHYKLYVRLSCMFATLYSVLPLVAFGSYDYDFDCETYTFSMILPLDWTELLVVTLFWMRSIKPVFFMIVMIIYCKQNEANYEKTPENLKQIKITKSVSAVALVTMLSYTPICYIRGNVILKQLTRKPFVTPPAKYIIWASWLHWVSPALTPVILFAIDQRFYDIMINSLLKRLPYCSKRNSLITKQEDHNEKTD